MAARAAEAIEVAMARGGGGDNDDSLTVTEGMGPMAARGAQGQSKVTPHVVGPHGGAGPYLPVANMSVTVTPLARNPFFFTNPPAPLACAPISVKTVVAKNLLG